MQPKLFVCRMSCWIVLLEMIVCQESSVENRLYSYLQTQTLELLLLVSDNVEEILSMPEIITYNLISFWLSALTSLQNLFVLFKPLLSSSATSELVHGDLLVEVTLEVR